MQRASVALWLYTPGASRQQHAGKRRKQPRLAAVPHHQTHKPAQARHAGRASLVSKHSIHPSTSHLCASSYHAANLPQRKRGCAVHAARCGAKARADALG